MILWALLLLSASGAPDDMAKVERCRDAIHTSFETAGEICAPASGARLVQLFPPANSKCTLASCPSAPPQPIRLNATCEAVLERGVVITTRVPRGDAKFRAGLIRGFDQLYDACKNWKAPPETPKQPLVQLWD